MQLSRHLTAAQLENCSEWTGLRMILDSHAPGTMGGSINCSSSYCERGAVSKEFLRGLESSLVLRQLKPPNTAQLAKCKFRGSHVRRSCTANWLPRYGPGVPLRKHV